MAFGFLWSLLWPLLLAAFRTILPWLIERITKDVRAGRVPVIADEEIRYALTSHKAAIQASYRAGSDSRKFAVQSVYTAAENLLAFQRDQLNSLREELQSVREENRQLKAQSS